MGHPIADLELVESCQDPKMLLMFFDILKLKPRRQRGVAASSPKTRDKCASSEGSTSRVAHRGQRPVIAPGGRAARRVKVKDYQEGRRVVIVGLAAGEAEVGKRKEKGERNKDQGIG